VAGTDGNDTILLKSVGSGIVRPGKGADNVSLVTDPFTVEWRRGDGDDVLTASGASTLRLVGVARSDVAFTRAGSSILATVASQAGGPSETITLDRDLATGLLADGSQRGFGRILFDDGTVLDREDLATTTPLIGGADDDFGLYGSNYADMIYGNGGDDWIDGGPGDDIIDGGPGSDEFDYRHGEGNDTIVDTGADGETDTLDLRDLTSGSVLLRRTGNDLLVIDRSNGQIIKVTDQFASSSYGIEAIRCRWRNFGQADDRDECAGGRNCLHGNGRR